MKEYEAYKGVYCTLCKSMGKEYGVLSRMLLSYDGAFYVLFKAGLGGKEPTAQKSRCTFNPCKKCYKIGCEQSLYKLASAVTVMLAYFKLIDNINDSPFYKKILFYLIYPYFALIKRKAQKRFPEVFGVIEENMKKQALLEKKDRVSPDESAEPTAQILKYIFALGETEQNAEFAGSFGYQLGRAVYFIDAFDDYEKDKSEGSFNPFKNSQSPFEEAQRAVNLSLGALAGMLSQNRLNFFNEIAENIIYDGMYAKLQAIKEKLRGEQLEQSL